MRKRSWNCAPNSQTTVISSTPNSGLLLHRHDPLRLPVWAFDSHPISTLSFHLISNSRRVLVSNQLYPSYLPSFVRLVIDFSRNIHGLHRSVDNRGYQPLSNLIISIITPFPFFLLPKKKRKKRRNSHLSLKFSAFRTFALGSSSRFVFLIAATGVERVSCLLISEGLRLFNKLLRPRRKTTFSRSRETWTTALASTIIISHL